MLSNETHAGAQDVTVGGDTWEPKIIAFICNWCSYVGADLAGTSRLRYPENVRIIRVPCSGRIDPVFVVRSFQQGADGVLISGCHPGDCHYNKGNFYARRRGMMLQSLLEFSGLDPRRIQMSWVSASEGNKWAGIIRDMTEQLRTLGPTPYAQRGGLLEERTADDGNGQGQPVQQEAVVNLRRVPFDTDCDHAPAQERAEPATAHRERR